MQIALSIFIQKTKC